jgi:hypothetical protein
VGYARMGQTRKTRGVVSHDSHRNTIEAKIARPHNIYYRPGRLSPTSALSAQRAPSKDPGENTGRSH